MSDEGTEGRWGLVLRDGSLVASKGKLTQCCLELIFPRNLLVAMIYSSMLTSRGFKEYTRAIPGA